MTSGCVPEFRSGPLPWVLNPQINRADLDKGIDITNFFFIKILFRRKNYSTKLHKWMETRNRNEQAISEQLILNKQSA